MVLTGQVTNVASPFVLLLNGTKVDTIQLDTNGRFTYEPSNSKPHFVGLMAERSILNIIYLKPGSNVLLEMDGAELKKRNKNNIKVSGDGSEESAFLLEYVNNSENRDADYKYNSRKLNMSKPEAFEKLHWELHNANLAKLDSFLKENPDSEAFVSDMKILENLERTKMSKIYPIMHRMIAKDSTEITYNFKKFNAIPLDNANLYNHHLTYSTYVDGIYRDQYRAKYPGQDPDAENVANVLDFYGNNTMKEVAERKVNSAIARYVNLPMQDRTMLKENYKKYISKPDDLAKAANIIKDVEKLAKGSIAPDFTFPNQNEKMVSLSDFKGKYIYIDLWATWCRPCIAEIPTLEKLQEEFKDENIVFMSVAIKDRKAKWEKMLVDRNMGGIQLYSGATIAEASINADYVVNTIPRFLIIDPDGNIVDAFAPRPSDATTKPLLKQLLSGNTDTSI